MASPIHIDRISRYARLKNILQRFVLQLWFQPKLPFYLWPLCVFSFSFQYIASCRRYFLSYYQHHNKHSIVIVVGNIVVGGSGKTPCVLALTNLLQQKGFKIGLVTRGYGAKRKHVKPYLMTGQEKAEQVGDESLLLARMGVPVVLCVNRQQAYEYLLQQHPETEIVISDDGLQHYTLSRTFEILVYDATMVHNKWMLPLGPLREPLSRCRDVDWLLSYGKTLGHTNEYPIQWQYSKLYNIKDPTQTKRIEEFSEQTVQLIAGIGHPQRLLKYLHHHRLLVRYKLVLDHQKINLATLSDEYPIIMTEKDAVKYSDIQRTDIWVLAHHMVFSPIFINSFLKEIDLRRIDCAQKTS